MGIKTWMAACAAAMSCAAASEAGATIYTLTIEGKVYAQPSMSGNRFYDQTDHDGLFGPAGASLAGDAYAAVFVADSTRGRSFPSEFQIFRAGGADFDISSPIISASLTINGITRNLSPGWHDTIVYDYVYQARNPADFHVYALGQVWSQDDEELAAVFVPQADNSTGIYHSADGGTALLLTAGNMSISPVPLGYAFVPEPTTWAMLILGLGMIGLAVRRRTKDVALAA